MLEHRLAVLEVLGDLRSRTISDLVRDCAKRDRSRTNTPKKPETILAHILGLRRQGYVLVERKEGIVIATISTAGQVFLEQKDFRARTRDKFEPRGFWNGHHGLGPRPKGEGCHDQ